MKRLTKSLTDSITLSLRGRMHSKEAGEVKDNGQARSFLP